MPDVACKHGGAAACDAVFAALFFAGARFAGAAEGVAAAFLARTLVAFFAGAFALFAATELVT